MSYFANVQNGIVVDVISADQWFIDLLPNPADWIQTSYNTRGNVHYNDQGQPDGGIALRGNFAGIGFIYDAENDVFYQPQPYPSWHIDSTNWLWEAPVPCPAEGGPYVWDEATLSWVPLG